MAIRLLMMRARETELHARNVADIDRRSRPFSPDGNVFNIFDGTEVSPHAFCLSEAASGRMHRGEFDIQEWPRSLPEHLCRAASLGSIGRVWHTIGTHFRHRRLASRRW